MEATRDLILSAAARLATVCDGAVSEDARGYNGYDSPIAKSILGARVKTDRQIYCLWSILKKYRRQLDGFGISYDTLVPPPLPPKGTDDRGIANTSVSGKVKLGFVETEKYGRRIFATFDTGGGYSQKFNAFLAAVRKMPTKYFDGAGTNKKGLKGAWLFPDKIDVYDDLVGLFVRDDLEIETEPELAKNVDKLRLENLKRYEASKASDAKLEVPVKMPLYPFQRAGVKWIDDLGGRAMIADEMGCGKTPQALGWLSLRWNKALPALVVCPATLRINWIREAAKFTDFRCLVISSKTSLKSFKKLGFDVSEKPLPGYDLTIMNYDLFSATLDPKATDKKTYTYQANGMSLAAFGKAGKFQTLICDESHYIKDRDAQRTKAVLELSKAVKNAICLTGTPLLNRPKEVWSQIQVINPKVFPSFWSYAQEFCAAHRTRFGWDTNGASNLDELDKQLRENVMIRRLKKDVLQELPDKVRLTIPILLGKNQASYEKNAKDHLDKLSKFAKEKDEWKSKIEQLDAAEQKKMLSKHAATSASKNKLTGFMMEEIEEIKQAAVEAKFEECVKFIRDAQEQEGKILVFMSHHKFIDRMVETLQKDLKVDRIDGRSDAAQREVAKERFQNGDLDVLVCGIRAASEGLTLTAAHTVIFVEFDWNPSRHEQAEARVHRIGQKALATMYYLVGVGTIEESIVKMIDAKREVTNASLGESARTLDEAGIMDAIVREVLEKR